GGGVVLGSQRAPDRRGTGLGLDGVETAETLYRLPDLAAGRGLGIGPRAPAALRAQRGEQELVERPGDLPPRGAAFESTAHLVEPAEEPLQPADLGALAISPLGECLGVGVA